MKQQVLKKRRGGNQILAAAILVGIVVAAAGVYSSGVMAQISTISQSSRIMVQDINIIQDDGDREWFSAVVKNEGNIGIEQINATLHTPDGKVEYEPKNDVLKPSRTVTYGLEEIKLENGVSPELSIGDLVQAEFKIRASDGSIASKISSVRVS